MTAQGWIWSPMTQVPTSKGIRVTARKCPNTVAPATMTRIMQVTRVVSTRDWTKPFQDRCRPATAISRVPKAPTAAASVGVKTPLKSPPMTATKRMRVSTTPVREAIFSRRLKRAPGMASSGRFQVQMKTVAMKRMVMRMPGMTPARKSLPTDCSVMTP